MKMKTRKNFKISFTILTLLIAGLFISCQQGERVDDKVRNEVENLRDNLNDLNEDDSNFADNLQSELEDFEESMNDLKEDVNESGEQINMEIRQAMNDLQAEARTLRMKVERKTTDNDRSGFTGNMRNNTGDAVSGDRTAQAQRDTTVTDTTGTDQNLFGDNTTNSNQMIDQEIRADFQNFKQNINQWVDRLSARTNNNNQDYN